MPGQAGAGGISPTFTQVLHPPVLFTIIDGLLQNRRVGHKIQLILLAENPAVTGVKQHAEQWCGNCVVLQGLNLLNGGELLVVRRT